MGRIKLPKKLLGRGLWLVFLAAFLFASSTPVLALTDQQRALFTSGIKYFNTEPDCTPGGSGSGGTSGGLGSGSNVYILGDSITVRAQQAYQESFLAKGVTANIDGSSSRSINGPGIDGNKLTGMQAIAKDQTQIKAANAIVVALGTNGGDTPDTIDGVIAALKKANSTAPIYWVDTIGVNAPGFAASANKATNAAIYGQASKDDYTVVSWYKVVDPSGDPQNPSSPEKDPNKYIDSTDGYGVHPSDAGKPALANVVVKAVTGGGGAVSATGNSCCSTGTSLTGGTNAQKVWNFFTGQGLTPIATAGVMGNLNLESGGSNFDPAVKQGFLTHAIPSTGDGATGFGVAQWTDRGRQAGLFKLMDAANLSKYYGAGYGNPDTDKNMPAADTETLLGIELTYAWSGDSSPINGMKDTLNSQPDVTAVTTYFQNTYERPASATASIAQRIDYANEFLQQFGGGGGGGGGGGTSCGSTVLGGVSSVKDGVAWANKFVSDTESRYSTKFSSLNNQDVPSGGGLTTEVMYIAHHDHGAPTCWGAADCGQCTAVSGWFINNLTTVPGASSSSPNAWGNGVDVVGNLKAKGVPTGQDPRPFSIFSTNAYSPTAGHTGLVLGVLSSGAVITLENNMSDATNSGTSGNLTIREYSDIKQYFKESGGSSLEFAYVSNYMKVKPGGVK